MKLKTMVPMISRQWVTVLVLVLLRGIPVASAHGGTSGLSLTPIATFETGVFDGSAAEIVAFDEASQRLFIVNGADLKVDVVDISLPAFPTLLFSIDVSPYGRAANSVAVKDGVVAAAVEAVVKQQPGSLVFFDTDGNFLSSVEVGALPDMVTFTPDGTKVVVANEGEPDDDYLVDPEGSVSIVDVSDGVLGLPQSAVTTADFSAFNQDNLDPGVRVFGPNATPAQDFEPEFIAISADSSTAYVVLQENNALATVDLDQGVVTDVIGLGSKNHRASRTGLDASNLDGAINIQRWPVRGLYQPDAIVAIDFHGDTLLITANEGDAREYLGTPGFVEEARVADLALDPHQFPDAASLQLPENLGRLKVTTVNGDRDGDGDFDTLFSFGARSFSIWTDRGVQLFDSRDALEQITASALPADFNSTNDENGSFDDRSDDKGPEPEGLAVGRVKGRMYLFVGLERVGGVAVFDITIPFRPRFETYVNNRDFAGDPVLGTAGDLGPEGLLFIDADDSPSGNPLLVVANEVSGSTTLYEVTPP